MDIGAFHGNNRVQIDLQIVRDTLLDREGVVLMALPPAREFREDEEEGDHHHSHGPFPTSRGLGNVLRFCFRWNNSRS